MTLTRRQILATALLSTRVLPASTRRLVRVIDTRNMTPATAALLTKGVKVLLDGKDITSHCVRSEEYSDGTLVATCYVTNARGVLVLNESHDEALKVVRRGFGSVTPSSVVRHT